jgi:protein-disulfide isomerase
MRTLALTLAAMSAFAVTEGNPKSPVRVIVYEDLQCSDCAAYRKMMDEHLLPKYGDRVAFEHRDFPLAKHAWARRAAVAARYFDSVNGALGIEFRRWAMTSIPTLTTETFEEKLAGWAKSHGTDPVKAVAALKSGALMQAVEDDYQDGVARGVSRTPTVFVNGEAFIETFAADEISKGIEAALAASRK